MGKQLQQETQATHAKEQAHHALLLMYKLFPKLTTVRGAQYITIL